jgi:integrase
MSVYPHKGTRNFHYDFWFRNKRYHGSTECTTRRAALRYEALLKKNLRKELPAIFASRTGRSFHEVREDYWEKVGQFTVNASSLRSSLDVAESIVGTHIPISLIDDHAMLGYRTVFRQMPSEKTRTPGVRENSAINDFTRLIARLVNYARDIMKEPQVKVLDPSKWLLPEEWRMRELGLDEEGELRKHSEPELERMWEFVLETGIRRKPLCTLRWNQVDRNLKQMVIIEKGKKKPSLVVPLSERAMQILKEVEDQHPELVFTFVARKRFKANGRRYEEGERYEINPAYFWRCFKDAVKAAKISDFTVHDLRHTAATRLLRSCRNVVVVQRFLGHTTLKQTERYVHMVQQDVAAAIAARDIERSGDNLRKIAILTGLQDSPEAVTLEHLSMAIELRVQLDRHFARVLKLAA